MDSTSIWSARIGFHSGDGNPSSGDETVSTGERRDGEHASSPEGNASIWGRADPDPLNPSPSGTLWYQESIQYNVRKTGYYCVGALLSPPYPARTH